MRFRLNQAVKDPAPQFPRTDEYGYVLNSIAERFGSRTADEFSRLPPGQWPITHTTIPKIGEVMVWQSNAGLDTAGNYFGKANEQGHVGLIVDIEDHGGGNLTLTVAERGWDTSNGRLDDGTPFRLIDVRVGADGTVALPDGIGFLDPARVNFDRPSAPENPPPVAPDFDTAAPYDMTAGNLPYSANDEYGFVLNYLSATRDGQGAAALAGATPGKWQYNSQALPEKGEIMVWQAGKGDANIGFANRAGHVAVVIDARDNGNGTATLTLAEQNWTYNDKDVHGMLDDGRTPYRQITVPLNPDGTLDLPSGTGFITRDADLGSLAVDPDDPYAGLKPSQSGVPKFNQSVDTGETVEPIEGYEYTGCVRYITSKFDIAYTRSQGGAPDANGHVTTMGFDFERRQISPQAGMIMGWAANVLDNPYTGGSFGQGHVAYVERVAVRQGPNGRLFFEVSLSEGNDARSPDKIYRRTLLIPVQYNAAGQPVTDPAGNYLPDLDPNQVGFSQP